MDDARRVADRLEIPYYVMNFKREFKKNVMDYFTAEYLKGRTPNPVSYTHLRKKKKDETDAGDEAPAKEKKSLIKRIDVYKRQL